MVGAAALRIRQVRARRPDLGGLLVAVPGGAAAASLTLPAVRFPGETQNGFEGLDVLSVLLVVALALLLILTAFATALGSLRRPAAACLAGLLGGNLLIQRFTPRGSSVEYGLWWATALAGVALVAALGVRGQEQERR